MEDGNIANPKDDKNTALSLAKIYSERGAKFTPNGHEFIGEASSTVTTSHKNHSNVLQEDKSRKRINPLRIHLGKRPYVDNSLQYYNSSKKRRTSVIKTNEPITAPIVPKLIPKRVDRSQFHNVSSHTINAIDNESDKPVPRLVPKSQLSQYKKSKMERSPKKEHSQNVGLQPMVNFKCRKCCSMSFKTLALLKEHQLICQAHSKEPALSPEEVPENDSGGPSRVTRKVYLCSACGTYYENWNLFLHMREIHNRHICLYCLGMFAKAEKLSSHLANKHNVQEYSFDNKEEVLDAYNGAMYLMCCVCDEICSEQDDFFNHDCNDVKPRPVPVLVSKSGLKSNNLKKNKNHVSTNGITSVSQEAVSTVGDNLGNSELKIVIPKSLPANTDVKEREAIISDTSFNSESSDTISKDNSNNIDSGMELESPNDKAVTSTTRISPTQPNSLPNGDEQTDDSDTRESDNYVTPSLEKEKECGIKLKLSLNNANSPVIINSTVDPSVGKNKAHKPPTRMRRPPKRYEKDMKKGQVSPLQLPSKLPSIKMTICDKANSPFIKSTIYEMDSEPSIKPLNNNLESMNPEHKPENVMKTTIYDNKLEEENTMNRVPKLTVRVPKELLDKDSSSDDSSDSESSDKLTVDENNVTIDENNTENGALPESEQASLSEENVDNLLMPTEENQESQVQNPDESCALKPKTVGTDIIDEVKTEEPVITEPDIPITELTLNRPLDKYPLKELLKVFLGSTVLNCIYCNHARKIAVNCQQLSLHMVAEHRFSATVDSITAEELMPETITAKVKAGAEDLQSVYINLDCYDSVDKCDEIKYDYLFECFQCFFKTAIHKELCIHNRKMHQKTILWCVMCKSNFYTYSELLCHLCPGTYDSESDIKFRCHLCNVGSIPSSFRLMVHLRKIHHTCDVCLEFCHNQQCLSNHVWKHKLHHLCYRCGIAYRNKLDISNHLFWKHGTEGVLCKKCLHKKWPHVYHFCSPPAIFICEDCNLQFTKAVYLKVHKRFHTNEYPHVCTEESCTEKFVSKKLLNKHIDEHRKKLFIEELSDLKPPTNDIPVEIIKDSIPVIDLIDDKPKEEAGTSEVKEEHKTGPQKKTKKKKKDKDALLLDVNLPALNLSESDSSDESDSGFATSTKEVKDELEKSEDITSPPAETDKKDILIKDIDDKDTIADSILDENKETKEEEKTDTQQILDIWDNFKKYQAKVEKQKEKLPPLVPIRKHVCESDHDYCIIPSDLNGDEEAEKKKSKKTPKKKRGEFSSSSSSSSDSDSSCSCGSNCSCSSSSGSSSSSSSDSDSSDDPGTEKKKPKRVKRLLPVRRLSNGSNVDVMGMSETPILIPEKTEPPIAESDLETSESETDEEFYDENPQQRAKMNSEKRNQLLLLTTTAPSDGGSVSGEASRPITPVKEAIEEINEITVKEKPSSSKKKSKKKKKSKSSRKHLPIKINIPKDVITKGDSFMQQQIPNKITISLQSNTVQIPEASNVSSTTKSNENKRASKRRRVPNKFYGYSSDEEGNQTQHTITPVALKPQLPPKLEWRKEDLPSPTTHKPKKEAPSQAIAPARLINYPEPIRLTTPIPDPVPPRILMNTESMESSDSDSSDEGALEICQPYNIKTSVPAIPPTYLNSGTSSLPYAFKRPVVREAREGESVYCYCRCPYDEVSEMIACDAEGCTIEWFHFECVGIMVPPKGKWYCPECRKNQNFPGVK